MNEPSKFDPAINMYKDPGAAKCITIAGVLGVVFTFITIVAAVAVICLKPPFSQAVILVLAALWGIGGPMWFFYEYFFIYRKHGAIDSWEHFKHGQQLSAAVWIALTATLTVIGTSQLIEASSESYRCELDPSTGISAAGSTSKIQLTCTPK